MNDFFMDSYKRTGLVFSAGQGCTLVDDQGRSYLDFTSGIGVNVLGHGHAGLRAAINAQLDRLMHVSNYYQTNEALAFARELCAVTGMDALFLCNSGAEANEAAIKIARKHGASHSANKVNVVSLKGSFHGRTIAMLAATGQDKFHENFGPFPPGFSYVDTKDLAALDRALDDSCCAFIYEPIQGEGGVHELTDDFLLTAVRWCRERGILVIADEIQSGNGRTGSFLASTRLSIRPDIVTLAKGLAGGIPIGVVAARGAAATVFGKGDHGSTFGGNPLAAAAAAYVLGILKEPSFLESVRRKGELFRRTIESWHHPAVSSLRGRGLMIGIGVNVSPDKIKMDCIEDARLLVLTAGNDAIRLLPPLVIGEEDIEEGLGRFKSVLDKAW